MHNKVRKLRVVRNVFPHCWANDVYLEVFLTSQLESSFCQRGSEAHTSQIFRNLGMDQLEDISAQTVFKVGDFAIPLDFEAASGYQLHR